MTFDIYQRLWDNDENRLAVSIRQPSGEWQDENADILLDQQVRASGNRDIDLANRPLFYRVNEARLFDATRTYVSLIQLLNNYTLRCSHPELESQAEKDEQEEFLSKIILTKPIQIAREYINKISAQNLSSSQFQQKLNSIWFTLYTNYFQGYQELYCSGFEHVFVGEGQYRSKQKIGEVSGYHSWVKFYLDEQAKTVNFLGNQDDFDGDERQKNPDVVSLQMTQSVVSKSGTRIAELFKHKSAFFVGTSPECEMAMATVAYYESLQGKIKEQRPTTINGRNYQLVIYRNIHSNGSSGEFIRSFYPIFLGTQNPSQLAIERPRVRKNKD